MKKLAALLMILSVSVFTVGCGKTDDAAKSPAKTGTAAPGDKPADTPADKPADKPADAPADKPE